MLGHYRGADSSLRCGLTPHSCAPRGSSVGKTAVITRFTAGLDIDLRVLRAWCDPLAAPRPSGPLLDELGETRRLQRHRR